MSKTEKPSAARKLLAAAIQDGADRILIEKRCDGKWMVVASDQHNNFYNSLFVGVENCTLF